MANTPPDPNKPDPDNPSTQRADQDLTETNQRLSTVRELTRGIATTLGISMPYVPSADSAAGKWRSCIPDMAGRGAILMNARPGYFKRLPFTGADLKADNDELPEIDEAIAIVDQVSAALRGRRADLKRSLFTNSMALLKGINLTLSNPLTDDRVYNDLKEMSTGLMSVAAAYNKSAQDAKGQNAKLRTQNDGQIDTLTKNLEQANTTIDVLRGQDPKAAAPSSPAPKASGRRSSKKTPGKGKKKKPVVP